MFQRGRVVLGEIAVSTVKTVALAISLTGTSAGALSSSPSSRSYIVSPLSFTATFLGPSHRAMSSIFGTWMRSALPQYSPSRLTVALSATILILGSAAFKRETTTSRVAPRVSRKKWTLSSVVIQLQGRKAYLIDHDEGETAFARIVCPSTPCERLPLLRLPISQNSSPEKGEKVTPYRSDNQSALLDLLEDDRGIGSVAGNLDRRD